ncbi:hypothetical protein OTU49_004707 [Cherax quadricarinatus]|uniref:Uncharacterized protein n=1 Tax=Cherax quadricarinatus TaxID=27406 RepID=A0AAW0WZ48_CHEQU
MKVECKSPMVVVAHRLPFTLQPDPHTGKLTRKPSAGGLVTAVAPVVVETQGLWVGWSGLHLEDSNVEIPEADPNDQTPTAGLKSSQVIPVILPKEKLDDFYDFCNSTLWPLFHYMPHCATFHADKWEVYKEVNAEFARLTVLTVKSLSESHPGSVPLVWLHDFHMMLAVDTIREKCHEENIPIKLAFFHHIPFPSWDIMHIFPWEDELLQSILGCDSVGFQTEDYCLNFIDCCQRRLGSRVHKEMLVEHNSRVVSVSPLPISIPYDRFVKLAEKAPQMNHLKEQLLLGVDSLDYSQGLLHRFKAFETLLKKHPELTERITFLQVVVPSHTGLKVYKELDEMIDSINKNYSTPNWIPIRCMYGCISQDELAGFYRDASVAVVTPLRDGMTLVAKEYVACQTRGSGVLILSYFAGACSSMQEALNVNPYETNEFADTLHRALTMSKDERELRIKQLRRREQKYDANFWFISFLKTVNCLGGAEESVAQCSVLPLSEEDFSKYLGTYVTESSNLALLLDYDGTLAPIVSHPDLAQMPDKTRSVLEALSNVPDVHIAIISGRAMDNLKSIVGIQGITYAGNHGFEIHHPDGTTFMHPVPDKYKVQLESLKRSLEGLDIEGAWVEDKGTGITFHYRKVDKEKVAGLTSQALKLFEEAGISPHQSLCAYEGRPPVTWNKGYAAVHILRTIFGSDWSDNVSTIFVGDDKTDEDAIKTLKGMAVTFRVTGFRNVKTTATHCLSTTDDVFTMLKWIEKRLRSRASAAK